MRTRPCLGATAASVAAAGKRITYFDGLRRLNHSAASAIGMTARPAKKSGAWKLIEGSFRVLVASLDRWPP